MLKTIRKYGRNLTAAFTDLLLPGFCLICGPCIAAEDIPHLCNSCAADLQLVDAGMQCQSCASTLTGFERGRGRCLGCFQKRAPWTRLVVLGPYDGLLAQLIRRLKFECERSVATTLGELMAAQVGALGWEADGIDAVVVIPLDRDREKKRGFNQSTLISTAVAECLGISVQESWLRRCNQSARQVGRSAHRRRKMKASVFESAPQVFGRRLLLIDDVVTTQGTIRAAVNSLKKAGAIEVRVLCCARTMLAR